MHDAGRPLVSVPAARCTSESYPYCSLTLLLLMLLLLLLTCRSRATHRSMLRSTDICAEGSWTGESGGLTGAAQAAGNSIGLRPRRRSDQRPKEAPSRRLHGIDSEAYPAEDVLSSCYDASPFLNGYSNGDTATRRDSTAGEKILCAYGSCLVDTIDSLEWRCRPSLAVKGDYDHRPSLPVLHLELLNRRVGRGSLALFHLQLLHLQAAAAPEPHSFPVQVLSRLQLQNWRC